MADPLERLIANLESLASSGAEDAEKAAADEIQSVLERQYDAGRAPGGDSWAAKADGTASHLQKSGAMRANTKAVRGVGGVSVRIPKPGGFHQSGTKNMPA